LPLLAVNSGLLFAVSDDVKEEEISMLSILALGVNSVLLYATLIAAYFFHLSFKYYVGIVGVLELALLLLVLIEKCSEKKKKT
jgi:hypothetical protein